MKHCLNENCVEQRYSGIKQHDSNPSLAPTNQQEWYWHVAGQRAYQTFPNSRQGKKNRRKHRCTMFCWSPLKYIIHILTFNGI